VKRPALRSATRWAVAVVSLGAGSIAAVAGLEEASANPPAPPKFPDPFVIAPKVAERPSAVRKHEGGCFVTYPSGGAAKVTCPKELELEPVGQQILRDDTTAKCRQVPATSWSGGSTGEIPCPTVLLVVATPGVMPDPSATPSASASAVPSVPTGFDPPMGGLSPPGPATVTPKAKDPSRRKDDDAPKATGCANACTIGARDADDVSARDRALGLATAASAMAAIAVRRTKRRKARA
jgi:hypothetical protein